MNIVQLILEPAILLFLIGIAIACGKLLERVSHIERNSERQIADAKDSQRTITKIREGFAQFDTAIQDIEAKVDENAKQISTIKKKLSLE